MPIQVHANDDGLSSIMNAATGTRVVEVLRRYVDEGATLSLGSVDRLFPIPVELSAVEPATGFLTLVARCGSEELDHYLLGERVALDAEVAVPNGMARCFSVEDVDCDWRDRREGGCEIRCQAVEWAPHAPRPGGIRVPFVCGMSADVAIEMFAGGHEAHGRILDMSAGGCRVQVPVHEGTVFGPGDTLSAVTITFPGGEVFRAGAQVRHLRPLGALHYLAVGLQFTELDARAGRRLRHLITEAERQLAWQLGISSRGSRPIELFHRGESTFSAVDSEPSPPRVRDAFMDGVREICRKLYTIAICLRGERWFPADLLDSAARDLLVLLESDRARLLYALGCLQGEPRWMRHTMEVAAVLGDLALADAEWREDALEAVAGALLHALGKPLLKGPALPTLESSLSDAQHGHLDCLLVALERVGWEPGPITLDVMANINERLDGTGYPAGKPADRLSPLARMAAVIKMSNKLLYPGAGQPARMPADVWRWLLRQSDRFHRDCVLRLAQRHGSYPVGCLAKFSRGFLGWVRAQDDRGLPAQVRVARNLAFPDTTLSTLLSGPDLDQLGEPEGVVNAEDYGVSFPSVT